jgi:F-type H+-transporting ATPase subunit b
MLEPLYMAQVLVSFFVLMGILTYFLYKPVRKFVADRAAGIEKSIRDSQAARLQAEQLLEKYQKDMAGARAESQRMLDDAVKQGQKVREQIIAEAREEASRIMAKSKADLEQEVVKAMALLRNEVADLAIKSAGVLINRELDDASHRSLIQETLEGMEPRHDQ